MAEYEAALGNQKFQSQHVEGATTLSFVAAPRFALIDSIGQTANTNMSSSSDAASVKSSEHSTSRLVAPTVKPRNEQELPGYLMALTQRLRHSSTICESLDTQWPTFEQPPIERQSLGGLLEKSAECYAHVMPLIEDYYTRMALAPPTGPEDYMLMMQAYQPRAIAAKTSIIEYRQMLQEFTGPDCEIFQSCAEHGFPFSPIIKFINPQMAQPTVIPHVFILFLAPFVTDEEHYEALRYTSGVFAGFEDVLGLQMDAAFPDLYVAAFWKRGAERDYFQREVTRRQGDFMYVMKKIWGTVDYLELSQNRLLDKTEILGISLKEYRDAQSRGLKLQHTRH